MTVAEIAAYNTTPQFANSGIPRVYQCSPAYTTYASFWTDTFGAPDDSVSERIKVIAFLVNATERYEAMNDYADLLTQPGGFWWDQANQFLFVNYDDTDCNFDPLQTYAGALGFTDASSVQYFDDVEYLPMIPKAPQYQKQIDFLEYGGLSLASGSLTIRNGDGTAGQQGVLDFLITSSIYGNEVFIKYGDEGDDYGDLVAVSAFSVDDYSFTIDSITIKLIDMRESQNASVPEETFSVADYPNLSDEDEGKIIPLIYGVCRAVPCLCVETLETVGTTRRYRAGLLLTALSDVEVKIDDIWTARTPENIDLTTGEFDVPLAVNASAAPYECRANVTGIANDGPHDVIIDLNQRFLGLSFNDSNYYTAEWYSETVSLSPVGLVIREKAKLYAVIADLQGKANVGFFYDIDGIGRRTIRIDNPNRDISAYIQFCEILNQDELTITTDSSYVYAKAVIKYDKNWAAGSSKSVTDDTYSDTVLVRYRNRKTLEVDSYLATAAAANSRAAVDAENYSEIRPIAELQLAGKAFFGIRTLDVLEIELSPGFIDADAGTATGRTYFGVKLGQIISLNPNFSTGIIKAEVRLRPYSDIFDDEVFQGTEWELADDEYFELETDEELPEYFTVVKE